MLKGLFHLNTETWYLSRRETPKEDKVLLSIPEELQAASIALSPHTHQDASVPDAAGD